MNEDVRAFEDALENLTTQKITSRRILTGILLKNSENSELLDRRDKTPINMSKIHDCESNSSPMILIGNQMVYS